ncbi:hypothetical protein [Acinetobacter sp. Marseille-Q1623]|uniref:hypothetical protein n=1 Tax=Acinetobacter sp. Marseille-Q1623 TaxID=2697501 RepID=UPI00157AB9B5|nr:hypothetical protein [Acinetobacter sp. Marseille-Q1623]
MLNFPIIMIISISFFIFVFLFYRYHRSNQIHLEATPIPPQQSIADDLLEFDIEINKILNNPHLSESEKERLTNEYAEKYLSSKSLG